MKNLNIQVYNYVYDCTDNQVKNHIHKSMYNSVQNAVRWYSSEFGRHYINQTADSCLSSVINFTKNYNYEN
jgi:hypothetical protein